MPTTNTTVPFASILVSDRLRRDLGDIDELAQSIVEIGLLQPLVVVEQEHCQYKLVAGGRRYAAIKQIRDQWWKDNENEVLPLSDLDPFCVCPVYIAEHLLTDDQHRTAELEENLRRKDMTWQEKVLGIGEIHRLRVRNARAVGAGWTCVQTGDIFGQSHASVVYAVKLSEAILNGDDEILKCETADEAVRTLLMRKKRDAERFRAALQRAAVESRKQPILANGQISTIPRDNGDDIILVSSIGDDQADAYETAIKTILHGDSLRYYMPRWAPEEFDGIYTDIPYGISVGNMESIKNIDTTSAEHDREANIADFDLFLYESYRALQPGSFCVFWHDIEHTTVLQRLAVKHGFRVQRWPLISKKNLAKNEAAAYNTTKDYEVIMVCGKGTALLATKRSTSFVPWEWQDGESARYTHPFKKPFSAHKWLLQTFFPPDAKLLDPYCGEGTGVLAALQLGYRITGIDLEEQHVDRARQHVADFLRQTKQTTML